MISGPETLVGVGGVRAWRARPGLMVIPALLFCAIVFVGPMISMATWAFRDGQGNLTLEHLRAVFGDDAYYTAFMNTFRISGWTTLLCLLIGYPYAYLMTVASRGGAALLLAGIMIPFWTSVLARSLAWVILLGRNGVVNDWLMRLGIVDQPAQLLFNSFGVLIGMVHVLLPFMILPIWAVLSRLDQRLPLAARSLGASPTRAFLHITLPLSMPGVMAGVTLVFMFATGFYITPALLGGPRDITIATLIEMAVRDLLDWSFGSMLSLVLMALVGLIFAIGAVFAGAGRILGNDR